MRSEFDITLNSAHDSAILAERIRGLDRERTTIEGFQEIIDAVDEIIGNSKPGRPLECWELWLSAARCLVSERLLATALHSGAAVVDAKVRVDLLRSDLETLLADTSSELHHESTKWNDLLEDILSKPLPVLYWRRDPRWDRYEPQSQDPSPDDMSEIDALPAVARLIVDIEGAPLVSPQEVAPKILYSIRLEAQFARWAEQIEHVQFRLGTTLAVSQYSISEFKSNSVSRTSEDNFAVTASGTLAFPFAQNDPFSPVVFAISAFFVLKDGDSCPLRVVGHDQLQFRIRSPSQTLLSSGWPRMDAHLHDLIQQLVAAQPRVRDEFSSLIPLLNGLTAVLGTFAQGGVLKGRTDIHESDFQVEVLKLLRMRLGNDVQEGPKQAGGITDIRYQGCIVELKVEKSVSDRLKIFSNYSSQPTQYSGAEARGVSLLLVLDLTRKSKPPGDLRNDILLERVETHGGAGAFPNWVLMFVVQGNTESPSSYSD